MRRSAVVGEAGRAHRRREPLRRVPGFCQDGGRPMTTPMIPLILSIAAVAVIAAAVAALFGWTP